VLEAKKSELGEKSKKREANSIYLFGAEFRSTAPDGGIQLQITFSRVDGRPPCQGWTLSADEIDDAVVRDLASSMPDTQMQMLARLASCSSRKMRVKDVAARRGTLRR
jgi:hypothetical protein